MIPQTLPNFPPRTLPFDVSATVRDAGGGIFVVCVCVCFKVAVWFCSELTKAPEVINICWRGRPLEKGRCGARPALGSPVALAALNAEGAACVFMHVCVPKNVRMCCRAGVMCNSHVFLSLSLCVCVCIHMCVCMALHGVKS